MDPSLVGVLTRLAWRNAARCRPVVRMRADAARCPAGDSLTRSRGRRVRDSLSTLAVLTIASSSSIARSRSSLTTTCANSSWAASSASAVCRRRVDLLGRVGAAAARRCTQRRTGRRRDEHGDRLRHRGADLARALDLDLEHDRRACGEPALELGCAGSRSRCRSSGACSTKSPARDVRVELLAREEVVADAVALARARRARGRRHRQRELGDALAAARGSASPCRPRRAR